MVAFINLQDSPMFHEEICSLEQIADELMGRCQELYKGCQNFMTVLGQACSADTSFAKSLEAFGGGQDDPVSVSIGGPVMSKFINVLLELATYKELLRSQVEHVMIDRLMHFMDVDLQGAKESRRRFNKAIHAYDQSREKFVSLKKNTHRDIMEKVEEDLQNSKSEFERSRFNLASSLMNIEAKKKYEFLESISAIMDAHLRYFKLGYDLLRQMEPFVHQVLTCAQQAKELANIEQDKLAKRIQEFRTEAELGSIRASSNIEPSSNAYGIHGIGMSSYKGTETIMLSTANEEVRIIKQGYLLKHTSLRSDWKRKFFVLDSQGTFYYYKNKGSKQKGFQHRSTVSAGYDNRVFATFRSRHGRTLSVGESTLGSTIVDLRTCTIKMDAEDTGLRLCFRVVSPSKTFTLQAESEADRMEWVNKITAVTASLFNSHFLQEPRSQVKYLENSECTAGTHDIQKSDSHLFVEETKVHGPDYVSRTLRGIPGNDLCAECSASEPDWASLNLGILLCIECSGVHRNLGVHVSKVRSLTLDVKVWEPTVLDLFRALGNSYCNSVWEGLLLVHNDGADKSDNFILSVSKPSAVDTIYSKEKYIHAKYVEKSLVAREASLCSTVSHASSIWQAVKVNDLREVYRCIVISDVSIVNTTYDEVVNVDLYPHANDARESKFNDQAPERKEYNPFACQRIKDSNDPASCLQGCSLLHLACQYGGPVLLELLLQFGADVNRQDFHGRTPLHHCISKGNYPLAKYLLRRGASSLIRDGGGLTVLDRAMEMGAITDEELFIMLAECR